MPLDDGTPPGERPEGFVYLLHSPAMPGMYKIGRTARSPYERAEELSTSTAIPVPYAVVSAVFVRSCIIVERHLHRVFDETRVTSSREFFCFLDHEHARRRFREEVFSLHEQIDAFGFENIAHDIQALADSLRRVRELEDQLRRQGAELHSLRGLVSQIKDEQQRAVQECEARSSRLITAYRENSDYLARRIAQIRDYCAENRTIKAGSVIDFIEHP